MPPGRSVLIVGSKDDIQAGWERAKLLQRELERLGVRTRLINKLGFVLPELHLVARYKVVSTPCVLGLDDGKVVLRMLGVPSARSVVEALRPAPAVQASGA